MGSANTKIPGVSRRYVVRGESDTKNRKEKTIIQFLIAAWLNYGAQTHAHGI